MKKRSKKTPAKRNAHKKGTQKKRGNAVLMEANFLRAGKATFVVTKNLLHNFVVRDTLPVNASFDKHYESMLGEMNKLFCEAAFMFFVATRIDTEHWRCRGAQPPNRERLSQPGIRSF
jgi:hypothetical protein